MQKSTCTFAFFVVSLLYMATIIDKLTDLEYSEQIALCVIEKDPDLLSIFNDMVSVRFPLVKTMSIENQLSDDTKKTIFSLFNSIILTKSNLINKYVLIAEENGLNVIKKGSETAKTVTNPSIEEPAKKGRKKKSEEEKMPRRYGKVAILTDIEKQGGRATNVQLAALEVNDLKNIYVNLSTRLINDMLSKNPKLSDEDYRDIRAAVKIVKNKVKSILEK